MTGTDDLALPDAHGMRWSAHAVDVDSGEVLFSSTPDTVLDTASVGKMFLLHTLMHDVEQGRLALEDTVTRWPSEWLDESGLWYLLQADTLSLYDVAALVGAVSDNHATNVLGRAVGMDRVAEHSRELGYEHSALDDIVRWPLPPGAPRTLSHANALELVRFCSRLSTASDLSRSGSDVVMRWLGAGMDLSMVASAFNLDPLAHWGFDRGIWLWNKTGTISNVRADTGVVMSPTRRIAYAVLANWDKGADARDAALDAMRGLGVRLRDALRD